MQSTQKGAGYKFVTTILVQALVSTAFLISSIAHSEASMDQTHVYDVEYEGKDAGKLEVRIKRDGSEYIVRSISHLSVLAQLVLKSYTIESRFAIQKDGLRLISGREILNESGEVNREFSVNYDKNTIFFSKGEPLVFPENIRIDADSFPLALMTSDLNSLVGESYLSISPKRARQYVYQPPTKETVSVPAGEFSTTKIVGAREDDPNRTISIWLDQNRQQLPVKIVNSKGGRETVLVLVE